MGMIILSRLTDNSPSVFVEYSNKATEATAPLKRHYRHSPDGFEWGYGGSGPADLAFAVIRYFYDEKTAEKYYHEFKRDIVSSVPRSVSRFEIDEAFVKKWLDSTKERQSREMEPKNIFNPLLEGIPTFSNCPICGKEFIDKDESDKPIGCCPGCGASYKK